VKSLNLLVDVMLDLLKLCTGHSALKLLSLCFRLFTQLPSDFIQVVYLRLHEFHHSLHHIFLADLFLLSFERLLHLLNGFFETLEFDDKLLQLFTLSLIGCREL
jgi:hypothetical protein